MSYKNEFFWGIVIGILLTMFGAYAQSKLFEKYDSRKLDNELAILTCKNLNSRYVRSLNVITSSLSSVFEDRWEEYITQGVYPWNTDKSLVEHFILKKHNGLTKDLVAVSDGFVELHNILIRIRRLQEAGSENTKSDLENNEKLAASLCKEIAINISKIEDELLHFE